MGIVFIAKLTYQTEKKKILFHLNKVYSPNISKLTCGIFENYYFEYGPPDPCATLVFVILSKPHCT